MTLSILARTALLLPLLAPQAVAQRRTAGVLQAVKVPQPDATLTLCADDRGLVAELRVPSGNGPQLLATTPLSAPDRWRTASPSSLVPLGVPQALVCGGLDWRVVGLGSEPGSMPAYD